MPDSLAFLALAGPLALAAGGVAALTGDTVRRALTVTVGAGAVALAVAAAMAAGVAVWGGAALGSGLRLGGVEIGPLLQANALTASMLLLVAFIGLVVLAFSRTYLEGHPRRAAFLGWMALTLASVQLLAVAGNLAVFGLAWLGTSLALHKLLLFFPERAGARRAAWHKFAVSRLADGCLAGAVILAAAVFGTLGFGGMAEAAPSAPGWAVAAVAGLVAAAAILKSAQFPFHDWLPDTVETPTPVSALLHAGVINAGGYLILRMSDVVSLSAGSMAALLVFGAVTAIFASAVMLTQTSVKVSLAWSTVAQMGFMLLQCGLGAFATAGLHIAAHALYKAHAFLTAGGAVDRARVRALAGPSGPAPAWVAPGVAGAAGAVAAGAALALALGMPAGSVVLVSVLLLGLLPVAAAAVTRRPEPAVILGGLALAAGLGLAALAMQAGAQWLLAGTVAPVPATSPLLAVVAFAVVLGFAALVAAQAALPVLARTRIGQALWVHVSHGLYVHAFADRLFGDAPEAHSHTPSHTLAKGGLS